jgi:cytochrome c553
VRFSNQFALPFLLLSLAITSSAAAPTDGQRLYREGVLASGQALVGNRDASGEIHGQVAACVNCHRRSGLGAPEGRIVIPPITGTYLFHRGERPTNESAEAATGQKMMGRVHYTEETVARAIRDGVGWDGRKLDTLMPRYALDDADMRNLLAYLQALSAGPVPGVDADTLDFATIIAPGADPAQRQGMLDVLNHFFSDRANEYFGGHSPVLQTMRRIHYRVARRWRLHVWELTGEPASWGAQLDQHYAAEPVFAVISGLGTGTWEPVHRFCERQSVPCILPNVDLPAGGNNDFYNIYFSQGVLLEADLLAARLADEGAATRRIVQVYRAGAPEQAAADALRRKMQDAQWEVTDHVLAANAPAGDLASAFRGIAPGTALALWLRPSDIEALPATPPAAAHVYVSGLLGGMEEMPLAPAWRGVARVTYLFNLPQARTIALRYPLTWFENSHIPVVAQRVQVNTYIACQVLSQAVGDVLGDFVRDYLIEQIENMLSKRVFNGYYGNLSLGPGQRFASKGGYFIHFTQDRGKAIEADGDWTVP